MRATNEETSDPKVVATFRKHAMPAKAGSFFPKVVSTFGKDQVLRQEIKRGGFGSAGGLLLLSTEAKKPQSNPISPQRAGFNLG
jgi:hypothetical protein